MQQGKDCPVSFSFNIFFTTKTHSHQNLMEQISAYANYLLLSLKTRKVISSIFKLQLERENDLYCINIYRL